jgi:PST family polysaccharide transporter
VERTTEPDWRLSGDLSATAARGGLVTAAATATRFVVQLLTTVVVARVLGPAEYGFAVVVVLVTGLAELLRVGGIGALVNQAPRLTASGASTLHLLSATVGIVAAGGLVVAAGPLAPALGFPGATTSLRVLALTFVAAGFSAVPTALLARNLRFVPLAVLEVTSMLIGVVLALVLALHGAGSVSLAVQAVAFTALLAVGTVLTTPWRPSRPARFSALRPELVFAADVTFVQLLNFAARSLDKVVVGAAFGPAAAGLYAQAGQLLTIPLEQVNGPLQRVAVPVLARVAADTERFVRYYRVLTALTGYVLWPTFAVLAVLADSVVALLFGPPWEGSVPIFRVLVVAGFAQTLGYVTVWVFVATGQGRRQSIWALISRPIVLLSCFVGLPWGVTGMATAFSLCSLVLVVPGFLVAGRAPGLTLGDLVVPILRPALVAAVAGSAALLTRGTEAPPFGGVALGTGAALAAAGILVAGLPPIRRDVLCIVRVVRPARPGR